MPTTATLAQAAMSSDPGLPRALHLTSRIRGRLDALEAALASQDRRAVLRVTVELGQLFEELADITYRRYAP